MRPIIRIRRELSSSTCDANADHGNGGNGVLAPQLLVVGEGTNTDHAHNRQLPLSHNL